MKKLQILAAMSLLIIGSLAWFWSFYPSVKNESLVESSLKNAEKRFSEAQETAQDPEQNGYLTPKFLPFWGRKSTEAKIDTPISKTFDDWVVFSTPGAGETIDHKALQNSQDSEYLQALSAFEEIEPELTEAWSKPLFLTPEQKLSLDNEVFNFIAFRKAAQCLVGYAEAKVAQGDHREAATTLVTTVGVSRKVMCKSALIQDMIGIAVQSIGCNGIFSQVDLQQPWGPEFTEDLTARLVAAVPPKEQFQWTLEVELLLGLSSVESLQNGKPGLLSGSERLPGALSREKRIYQNVMTESLENLKNNSRPIMPLAVRKPDWIGYLAGRTGVLVQILAPNFTRAEEHMLFNRAKVMGIATVFGIKAFQEKRGRLPQTLEELAQSGIPTVEPTDLQIMTLDVQGSRASLTIPIFDDTRTLSIDSVDDGWFEVENNKVVLQY